MAKWISIENRLPEQGSTVLVVSVASERVWLALYRGNDWWTSIPGGNSLYVTHWMPVPQMPVKSATKPDWPLVCQLKAQKEGWDIFDADGSADGRWQLQAIAVPTDHLHLRYKKPKFKSDTEAALHVRQQAIAGSVLHQQAIRFLIARRSKDVAKFKLSEGWTL